VITVSGTNPAKIMVGLLGGDMRRKKGTEEVVNYAPEGVKSPLDLYKKSGAVAQKVKEKGRVAADSMLAVYQDRLTYTFIMDHEVASIHYDRQRGEIFFKGHNIRNMDLDDEHRQALMDLAHVLKAEERGKEFSSDYGATLARLLADK
jgi:hypothetical protein